MGTANTTVLLVEDDDDSRDLLEVMLTTAGLQVLAYASAEEALDGVGDGSVSVVITDFTLPGASGAELVRALRRHPARATLRAFALTGRSVHDVRGSEDDIFDRVFVKPADFDALITAVRTPS